MTIEQEASRAKYLFPIEDQPPMPALAPLPTIVGGWSCIEADVPWAYKAWSDPETEEQKRKSRAVEKHYPTMSLEQIAAMDVRHIAAPDCHLWFWTTGPFLMEARAIMESWGFRYSTTGFVWIKLLKNMGAAQFQLMSMEELMNMLIVNTGTGKTTRKNAEFCLLGRRGRPKRLANDIHEVIISPRREHSRKPDEAYERIARYCPGPRLQLFSRQDREGWSHWGNETGKFE